MTSIGQPHATHSTCPSCGQRLINQKLCVRCDKQKRREYEKTSVNPVGRHGVVTPEMSADIRRMYGQLATVNKIARTLGISADTVKRHLANHD